MIQTPELIQPREEGHARPQWQLVLSMSSLQPAGSVTATRAPRFMQPAAAIFVSTATLFRNTVAPWLALCTRLRRRSVLLNTLVLTNAMDELS